MGTAVDVGTAVATDTAVGSTVGTGASVGTTVGAAVAVATACSATPPPPHPVSKTAASAANGKTDPRRQRPLKKYIGQTPKKATAQRQGRMNARILSDSDRSRPAKPRTSPWDAL